MKKKKRLLLSTIILVFIVLTIGKAAYSFILHGKEEEKSIVHNGITLSGSLYIPQNSVSFPLVIFIHGDGATDRLANDNYMMMVNAFLEKGVGCFSYDKPGTGSSEGNWLDQTMEDRAKEALTVKDFFTTDNRIKKTGFLGLSQGGWVLSEIAIMTDEYDFMMLIGGAIDWMDQSAYYQEMLLSKMDMSEVEKENYRTNSDIINGFLSRNDYEGYKRYCASEKLYNPKEPMSEERFHFVYLNMYANATEGIYHITKPFLGLFGEVDKNVDSKESYRMYRHIFNETGNKAAEVYLIKDGTHGLLKSRYENIGENPILMLEALLRGSGIYADDALKLLSEWCVAL